MQDIRNIAIIAHVDHGKTTLVDRMIYQANLVRQPENLGQLILDNNDLERERGITILAKNVSVIYKGVKINIIDTPGHSDFGGEVERVLNMADGVLLLVDAFEGCMPQTRFVLQKALEMGKKPIVVINKVDKPNCRPDEVQEEVFDLMFNLNATEEQLDFATVYGSAKQGWMSLDWKQPTSDITPLLDTILEQIPAPKIVEGTPQMLISSLEYSPYVGRIAVGRVTRGTIVSGSNISLCKRYDVVQKQKVKQLMVFEGLGKGRIDDTIDETTRQNVLGDYSWQIKYPPSRTSTILAAVPESFEYLDKKTKVSGTYDSFFYVWYASADNSGLTEKALLPIAFDSTTVLLSGEAGGSQDVGGVFSREYYPEDNYGDIDVTIAGGTFNNRIYGGDITDSWRLKKRKNLSFL